MNLYNVFKKLHVIILLYYDKYYYMKKLIAGKKA